jgi:tyrosinase
LGGWGDPNADYSVRDGGFSALHLSYPSPHTLRRNFTLRPYDIQSPLFPDPTLEANATFSAAAIETLLATAAGDFKAFQVALETFQVSA